jgi:hypothetical protein
MNLRLLEKNRAGPYRVIVRTSGRVFLPAGTETVHLVASEFGRVGSRKFNVLPGTDGAE